MYRSLSLLRLTELITGHNDKKALDELHTHRFIFSKNGQWVLLVDFLDGLRQYPDRYSLGAWGHEILEFAYDLTVGKFSNLPNDQKSDDPVKTDGPDCRYYFRAFLNHVEKKIPDCRNNPSAKMELKTAKLLQNFVIRHFYLSCLECDRRQQGLSRRYVWKVEDRSIPVWMPSYMTAKQCREWLAGHIDNQMTQKEQIQTVVDRHLQRHVVVSLSRIETDVADSTDDLYEDTESTFLVDDLTAAVANEKADNIEFQRPAIQALGPEKLKELIHQIFEGIAKGGLKAQDLARQFAISDAAFSRFASTRWNRELGISKVPDLWSNTASVLASNADFSQAAGRAGVLSTISQIIESKNA